VPDDGEIAQRTDRSAE